MPKPSEGEGDALPLQRREPLKPVQPSYPAAPTVPLECQDKWQKNSQKSGHSICLDKSLVKYIYYHKYTRALIFQIFPQAK